MASEYLKWKYRDVRPDAPRELTAAEKRKNWWHYHKWHIILGGVLLLALADIGWHALGSGEVPPDYQIAYVGAAPLPSDTAKAVETAFAAFGEDANGDGQVAARLNQYPRSGGSADAASFATAAEVRLIGDLEKCESFFFLLDDFETFQRSYDVLAKLDGTLPAPGDDTGIALRWGGCPALAGLDLGEYRENVLGQAVSGSNQDVLGDLYLARRGFWTERTVRNPAECEALWSVLMEGGKSG
ncbi:MAG: hypothetical protein IJ617_05020 [Oscillospiraceae bacterium]|nr:hypothetical protein [Oscillospiraceae bacterium]